MSDVNAPSSALEFGTAMGTLISQSQCCCPLPTPEMLIRGMRRSDGMYPISRALRAIILARSAPINFDHAPQSIIIDNLPSVSCVAEWNICPVVDGHHGTTSCDDTESAAD